MVLERLGFPPIGRHRAFIGALAIDALGSGIWMPLSMLYFLRITGMDLVTVGLTMTVANLASLPAIPFIGHAVDRIGPRRVMQAGHVLQAGTFALYPLVHSPLAIGTLVGLQVLGRTMFWGSNGPLITQITDPGEREVWFGFAQAMRNAGYGVGGLLAATILAIGSQAAYQTSVLANAASYVLAFLLLTRVRGADRAAQSTETRGGWREVARDRPYLVLAAVIFCFALSEMTLNTLMPVYFVEVARLPDWLPAAVFVVNTVMIGVGQGLVVRAMTGRVRSRVLLVSVVFTAGSFLAFWSADALPLVVAVLVVLAAAVVYTVGELTASPVLGALSAECAPEELRGRYMSVTQLSWNLSGAVAPALYAGLLSLGAAAAWLGPLALSAVFALLLVPLHRMLPRASLVVTNEREPDLAAGVEPIECDQPG